ncbi:MAG: c-type cytochrome [Pseudomonadota bacterium]|nr:c-type cytochrome [Pseudomonadota bacterium]
MAARVLACATCHGPVGQGSSNDTFPRLSGKPAGYLYNQLVAFRDGQRRYAPMNYLLAYLPNPTLRAIAEFYAAERPPMAEPSIPIVSAELLAAGKALASHGDPARGVPACSTCHGPAFSGMEPGIPGLVGLRPSYISAQLGAWRYGIRTAAAPDCMQIVAGHLTETDVTAVAAWLATLPGVAGAEPAPAGSNPMPLACGSEPR